MPFLARYSQKENTEQYQYHSSAGMLHHWWKSLQSERRPGCTKGVWWYPLDQSHQWRGQRKLPYLLPNIWRNFLGKDFWMWGNSWRICRERREGREGKAWLWIYGASAKILSLHIYIYMQWVSVIPCSTRYWSKWIGGWLWAWLASVQPSTFLQCSAFLQCRTFFTVQYIFYSAVHFLHCQVHL